MDMMRRVFGNYGFGIAAAGLATLLGVGALTDPAAAASRSEKYRKDARTCESFGSRYGTPAFTDCMLDQQRRRDTKQLRSLEQSAMASQLARDGQIMAERARRQRCHRNPDRKECGRR